MSTDPAEVAALHLKQALIALNKAHLHLVTARAAWAEPSDELGNMASTVAGFRDRLKEIKGGGVDE